MESSVLLSIFLPVALGVIMFGLGLSLSLRDFGRITQYPKAVVAGLFCQMVILPATSFAIASQLNLSPELAVGLVLLSASPGGVTSNFYTHVAKGDVVLTISLTALNSLLCIFSLPFVVNLAMEIFMDESRYIPLQFGKVLQIFIIILVPVSLGMWLHKANPGLAARLQKPVRIFSLLFLVALIVMQIIREKDNLGTFWQQTGMAALAFNLLSILIGFFFPLLIKIPKTQCIAISMENGIRNTALALTIALSPSLLNNSAMSIPAAIYSVVMYFSAAVAGYFFTVNNKQKSS